MADLTTLIRLHQYELDEKRRELKELYDMLEEIAEQKQQILDQLKQEEDAAAEQTGDVHFTLADFRRKSERDCAERDQFMHMIEQKIFIARDEMLDIFSEMKRYDMAQQERDRIVDEERRMRESKTLDEIALEGFRRKQAE